jgi:hypothetical protein
MVNRANARDHGMQLTMRIVVDQETYERLVYDAVDSPRSIPEQAGVVLRRAYGLPTRATLPELKNAPAEPATAR